MAFVYASEHKVRLAGRSRKRVTGANKVPPCAFNPLLTAKHQDSRTRARRRRGGRFSPSDKRNRWRLQCAPSQPRPKYVARRKTPARKANEIWTR